MMSCLVFEISSGLKMIQVQKMGSSLLTIATQIMVMSITMAVIMLFIGFGFLVLLHIYIVGRAFRRGLSTISRGEECNDEGKNGLSPDDLEKLPCYDFDGGEKKDCAVCLERFQNGDRCRLLPVCRHSFHADCVDCWLAKSPICPICRTRACQQEGGDKGFELRDGEAVDIGFPQCVSVDLREDSLLFRMLLHWSNV